MAESGSFSRCAQEFELGQPTVSITIDALEEELGVKLLHCSTRALALTDEGRKIFAEAKKVTESYDELAATAESKTIARGIVRVTCPTALGSIYLIPRLPAFMKKYPEIKVHLQVTDSFLDLTEGDVDVAFRVGELAADPFVAQKVGMLQRIAVAGTNYLQERPAPRSIEELQKHNCIVVGRSRANTVWRGMHQGEIFAAEVNGQFVADNHLAIFPAVKAGLGIGLAAKFIFEESGQLAKGLERVLPKVEFQPYPLNLLFKQVKNLPNRTRLFLDFFHEDLRKQKWLEA